MKFVLLILAVIAVTAAALAPDPNYVIPGKTINVVRSSFNYLPTGGYAYSFESEDGTVQDQSADVKEVLDEDNKPRKVLTVRGSYSFIDPEGVKHTIIYTADENGYNAEGDSVPKVQTLRRS